MLVLVTSTLRWLISKKSIFSKNYGSHEKRYKATSKSFEGEGDLIESNLDNNTWHMQLLLQIPKNNNTKIQKLNVRNTMEDVEKQYCVTLCWWLYSSAATKECFHNLSKILRLWPFYYKQWIGHILLVGS